MSYRTVRDGQMLASLFPELTRFAAHYVAGQPTLVMLPGGMASSLSQATAPFAANPAPPYQYELEWIGWDILAGAALTLGMKDDVDADGHLTIASGTIGLFDVTPYAGFVEWCNRQGFNYLIVPWDWRRPVGDTVDYLTGTVLPAVQRQVQVAHGIDFRKTGYDLVSHSFGGLVLKALLDGGGPWVDAVRRAITVAAPFYGYGDSQHFYFAGFNYLDFWYGTKTVAQLIGSMPGPYCLFYLDQPTYATAGARLASDPHYPLAAYPSMDAANPALPVDPYHPGPGRYPAGWFSATALAAAATARAAMAKPLPAAVLPKLYNIRGVQTRNGADVQNTFCSQTWRTIDAGFDPDHGPDPITSTFGPGDDTIPAWSARLVDTLPGNVVTIADDSIEHMTLMDNPVVLDELQLLITGQRVSQLQRRPLHAHYAAVWANTASPDELQAALRTARPLTPGLRHSSAAALCALPREEQNRLARRFIKDLGKAPAHHALP